MASQQSEIQNKSKESNSTVRFLEDQLHDIQSMISEHKEDPRPPHSSASPTNISNDDVSAQLGCFQQPGILNLR